MRALITGVAGFAGRHLARACVAAGDEVVGLARTTADEVPGLSGTTAAPRPGVRTDAVDLREAASVRAALADTGPDVIYHLAALSSVGRAWDEPARTLEENVSGAVNLLEAIRREAPRARVVWVSSCEVYGASERLPIDESAPIDPANPYAVSKAAGDLLAGVYVDAHGLDIVRARPFSHAGPGQRSSFLVSSLARQVVETRLRGETRLEIRTGAAATRRDFTDVRDIARAYRLLASSTTTEVVNVCSGRSVSAAEHVELLGELAAPLHIEHVVDPALVRAHEVAELRGSHERLTAVTGWRPEIPLRQTVADTIAWWERELAAAPAGDTVRH